MVSLHGRGGGGGKKNGEGRDSGLLSHPSAVVFVVGGLQGSGSTVSTANSLFDPYDDANVVYDVREIPRLIRETRKFLLLPDRPPPPQPPPRLRPNNRRYCRCQGLPLSAVEEVGGR